MLKSVVSIVMTVIMLITGIGVSGSLPPLAVMTKDTVVAVTDMFRLSHAERKIPVAQMEAAVRSANGQLSHPFILADKAAFDRVREQYAAADGDDYIKARFAYVLRQSGLLLEQAPMEYELPDGERLLEVSREVLNRVMTLACAWQVTRDETYAQRAWLELEKVCSYDDWHPAHFLDTAEMAMAVSLGYDWLFDYLTQAQKELLRDKTWEYAIKPAQNPNLLENWWTWSKTNWNHVCYAGIGIAFMTFSEADPKTAAKFLSKAFYNMPEGFEVFNPDGVYVEGNSYWEYGTSYLLYFISTARHYFGQDYGLSETPGFDKVGYFPLYISTPTGAFNYGDNRSEFLYAPALFWFAKEYDEPILAYYQKKSDPTREDARESALNVLWYDTAYAGEEEFDLPKSVYLRSDSGQELVTMRSAYLDPNAACASIKSGYNYTNHGDLDIGSFVFDAQGERWAEDLGKADYNAPGYFLSIIGAGRWKNYRKRAEGHNTLVINPSKVLEEQYPFASVKMSGFTESPDGGTAELDMTDAYYLHGVESAVRSFTMFDDYSSIRVTDTVRCGRPSEIYWFMHTKAEITVEEGGRAALLTIGNKRMRAALADGSDGLFTVMRAEPLPTSPSYDYNTPNDGITKLTVHLENVREANICVELAPC